MSENVITQNEIQLLLFSCRSFFAGYIYLSITGNISFGGWLLTGFFLSLSLAFHALLIIKRIYLYAGDFCGREPGLVLPGYFLHIGGLKLSGLILPLLQIIMFGMGTELSIKEFRTVLKKPRGILIGIICHYTIMPVLGFTLASLFSFPKEIAAGIILVGCCPSGLASNVMSFLARANLALSVSVTAVSTLLAPFLTPMLMRLSGWRIY